MLTPEEKEILVGAALFGAVVLAGWLSVRRAVKRPSGQPQANHRQDMWDAYLQGESVEEGAYLQGDFNAPSSNPYIVSARGEADAARAIEVLRSRELCRSTAAQGSKRELCREASHERGFKPDNGVVTSQPRLPNGRFAKKTGSTPAAD